MERTELRDAFFAETIHDPYAHMIAHLAADAWADGYTCALHDAVTALADLEGLPRQDGVVLLAAASEPLRLIFDMLSREAFADRRSEALVRMTDERRRADAELIVALAKAGPLFGPRE